LLTLALSLFQVLLFTIIPVLVPGLLLMSDDKSKKIFS
jgi:hypothetical protein